jgi:hypothetical protein
MEASIGSQQRSASGVHARIGRTGNDLHAKINTQIQDPPCENFLYSFKAALTGRTRRRSGAGIAASLAVGVDPPSPSPGATMSGLPAATIPTGLRTERRTAAGDGTAIRVAGS